MTISKIRRAVLATALVLSLAACGPSVTEEEAAAPVAETATEAEPTEEPTTEPEVEVTSAAEVTNSEEPEPAGPPEECEPEESETPLGAAISGVELPDKATINMVQELRPDSDEDQSLKWVVVYLCSEPLTAEEHRTVATDIAIAARDAEGGGDQIWRLSVGLDMPDGAGGLEQGQTLYVEEFGQYTWGREAARAPETIWEDGTD